MKRAPLRPWTAARALRALFADPDDTKQVFAIIDALQGPSLLRTHARLKRSDTGRRLLKSRPDLLGALCDRPSLRELPEGSLGRAYLDFVESEGITADGLVEASQRARPSVDPDLAWIRDWLRDSHDLWHVVLGYRGDLVGEAALLAFSHGQTGNPGLALIAAIAWFKLGRVSAPGSGARAHVARGLSLARRTAWFLDVPWHELLDRPLDDLRRSLGVPTPSHYTPVRAADIDVSLFGEKRSWLTLNRARGGR